MKIAVIGATGKQGSMIAEEALNRGHDVTAIVRNAAKVSNAELKVLEKDVFSLTPEDLSDFDVVVDAFGTPFGKGVEYQHQTSLMTITNAMKELSHVRLIVVGGAASLFTDSTHKHRVLESIPDEWKAVPENMFEAYKALQTTSIQWTYFSPAGTFDPQGKRTGTYRLGGDEVILNDEGESYISYADYAVALVDEIENGSHIRKRFTAVSNKDSQIEAIPEKKEDKFPPVEFEGGISQYRPPFVYELAGKSFYLIMDDGTEGLLSFMTGETLIWSPKSGTPSMERYDCLKADEDIYMVNLEVTDAIPRRGVTLVLDLPQDLVTVVIAEQGFNKRFPDLVSNNIVFGAIKEDGKDLPFKRHGYTSELVGKRIAWRYTSGGFPVIQHVYFDANYIRLPFPTENDNSEFAIAMREHPYDERCQYIKISKNIYLCSFLESNMTFRGVTGNNMLILMNAARLHDVGRSFGLNKNGGPENYCFAAVGKWGEPDGITEESPSKYRV